MEKLLKNISASEIMESKFDILTCNMETEELTFSHLPSSPKRDYDVYHRIKFVNGKENEKDYNQRRLIEYLVKLAKYFGIKDMRVSGNLSDELADYCRENGVKLCEK